MNLPAAFHLRVPFTSANLGPGFDLFGIALDLYARFQFVFDEAGNYGLFDEHERPLVLGDKKNYIKKAYLAALAGRLEADHIPGFTVHFQNDIPGGRGFGSSACAFVAGVAAANHLLREIGAPELTLTEELRLLSELEGHPDNSTPARVGGWVFVYDDPARDAEFAMVRKEVPVDLGLAALVPDYTVSTQKSRTVLPAQMPRADVLSGMRGSLLWLEYLNTGDPELLIRALDSDRMHEPYRAVNIPGFEELRRGLPCYGITISGSGPGMLVYYSRRREAELKAELETKIEKIYEPIGRPPGLMYCLADYQGSTSELPASS